MHPILFYGVPSGCSFGSIVALEWRGAPYQLCRVEMPGEVTGAAYRTINPLAETPTLRTAGGALLRESTAILAHLAHAADPRDPDTDRTNQWLGYLATTLFSAFSPLWYTLEHPTGDDAPALTRFGAAKVDKAFAGLELALGDGPYLLGARRTVADAYFAGIARWTDYHRVVDRRAYPRVEALVARLEADPGVQFAHAIEAGTPATSAGGFRGHVALADLAAQLTSASDARASRGA